MQPIKLASSLPHGSPLEVAPARGEDGVWDVVAGHLPVIVGLHGKGRVDAPQELLHGENAGYQLGPWDGGKNPSRSGNSSPQLFQWPLRPEVP